MQKRSFYGIAMAGTAAGIVNGLFGAGGGMILVPLLTMLAELKDDEVFSSSLAVMLPICIVALAATALHQTLPLKEALPYLAGSAIGGIATGSFRSKIPTLWLHRLLGLLIIWGGIRYLW